jgi:hypothetical protein
MLYGSVRLQNPYAVPTGTAQADPVCRRLVSGGERVTASGALASGCEVAERLRLEPVLMASGESGVDVRIQRPRVRGARFGIRGGLLGSTSAGLRPNAEAPIRA